MIGARATAIFHCIRRTLNSWAAKVVLHYVFGQSRIRRAAQAFLVLLFCTACQNSLTPTKPGTQPVQGNPPVQSPQSVGEQTMVLGQAVDVALDGSVNSGGVYCEVGEDPAPCARFVIDVPQAGTLVLRMDFDIVQSMFFYLWTDDPAVPGGVRDLLNVNSNQSPMIARQAVERGTVHLHAGLNVGWGLPGQQVQMRLLATLE